MLVGLAKGGFSGVGMLATPLLALTMSPVRAVAVLLPILALQDLVGVAAFRRHCEPRVVGLMLPGALLGIAAGWAFASVLPMIALMAALGLVSIASGLWRLARRAWPGDGIARPWPAWAATPCGFASGFASQIGNAGGPPISCGQARSA